MDELRQRPAMGQNQPKILVARLSQNSMDELNDIRGELFNFIESIDEDNHRMTNDELDNLYRINDELAQWNPETEVK